MSRIRSSVGLLRNRKLIVPVIVTAAIIVVLLAQISIRDITDHLSNLSAAWILAGAFFYLLTNAGRAVRLKLLLPGQHTRFRRLWPVAIAQSMFNNILPARTGEFSLLILLKKYEAISLDQSGVALVLARVADYVAVAVIFVAAALTSPDIFSQASPVSAVIWTVIGLMLLVCVVVITFTWWGRQALKLLRTLFERFNLASHQLVIFGTDKLEQIINAFQGVNSLKRYLRVMGWSLLIWAATFAWFYAFLRGIGVRTPVTDTIVGSTFAVLTKAVPFISIGGLGAHEAGWTVGFMLVGLDKTTAISSGFAVNILTLLTSIVFGVLSLWALRVQTSPVSTTRVEQVAAARADSNSDDEEWARDQQATPTEVR